MPSGINLSGNVPLRLEEMGYSVKNCDDRSGHPLGQKSRRRKRIQGVENAHHG
jgi:hypothetical protein